MTSDQRIAIELSELFQDEVSTLAQREEFQMAPNVVIHALANMLGALLVNGIRKEPQAGPRALYLLEQIRERVAAADDSASERRH